MTLTFGIAWQLLCGPAHVSSARNAVRTRGLSGVLDAHGADNVRHAQQPCTQHHLCALLHA